MRYRESDVLAADTAGCVSWVRRLVSVMKNPFSVQSAVVQNNAFGSIEVSATSLSRRASYEIHEVGVPDA